MTVTLYTQNNPLIAGTAHTLVFCLYQQADTKLIQVNPTMAPGDFLWSKDDAAPAQTTNLPTHDGNGKLHVVLTAAETTGITRDGTLIAHDAAGAQWCDCQIVVEAMTAVVVAAPGDEMDLVNAPNATAVAAIATQVDAELSTNHGNGQWGCLTGSGITAKLYTVTSSVTGLPMRGVSVFVTTDPNGVNLVATGITDAAGRIIFFLDPGVYYFFKQFVGYYDDQNPDIETVP